MSKTDENPPLDEAFLEACWQEFVTFLKKRGARVTKSRRIILEHVLRRHDHFRADEVAAALATGPGRVSRGTVYRTLALLIETGMIRQIRDSDTHAHYEHVVGHAHHEHMICDACGSFIEFQDEGVSERLREACSRMGFVERTHRVVVMGTCKDCTPE